MPNPNPIIQKFVDAQLPQPYYNQDDIKIYHGDCRDLLGQRLWAGVVITDPPYGKNHYATDRDMLSPEMLSQWTTAAVFGWPELLVRWIARAGREPDAWITWWPTNGACKSVSRTGLVRESEHIALFGIWDWEKVKVRRTDKAAAIYGELQSIDPDRNVSDPALRRVADVWRDASPGAGFNYHQRLHPNEKPLTMMCRLVGASEGVVLDPFMGSGTTLLAAKLLNRPAVGIEIEERYCEIAAKRLAQGVLNLV